jgi:hypothetical protein
MRTIWSRSSGTCRCRRGGRDLSRLGHHRGLTRSLSTFRAVTSLTCISSLSILHNLIKLLFAFFCSISFFFWIFAIIARFASSLISSRYLDSDLNRLRDNLLSCSSFVLICLHIFNFVSWRIDFEIISFAFLTKESNSSARAKSLHCMNLLIFDSHRFNSCSMSAKSWESMWRSNDNWELESRLKIFNYLMQVFELIDHISDFSNACRIIDDLNVSFLILVRSLRNCVKEYSTNDFAIVFWIVTLCQCL